MSPLIRIYRLVITKSLSIQLKVIQYYTPITDYLAFYIKIQKLITLLNG